MTNIAKYELAVAFNENVAGVFTLSSALDGPDTLTDVGLFAGTFDDVTDDMQAPIEVAFGTDNLMAQVQAANLTVTVARVNDPSYWNPNNPASLLNSTNPGFKAMRPVRLQAIVNGTTYGLFRGFLRHANWNSKSRSCELYCEDLLLWASRVFPVIASTGPIRVGAVMKLLWAAVDPTVTPICDDGILLEDFSADGTQAVPQIIADILAVDLGTVFVNGDGVPVYEQNTAALARHPVATITVMSQTSQEQSGLDLDSIGTRVQVTKVDPVTGSELGTWTSIDAAAERRSGRADLPAISSPYVGHGQALADELVYSGVRGKPPITLTLGNVDATTLLLMLTSQPLTVYAIADSFGGNSGDAIAQRITHTIQAGGLHEADVLCAARPTRAFALDSALDGPDTLRYP